MGTNNITPNVELIINEGIKIINGVIPRKVRRELNQGVKNNILGHLKKDGLLPEIYFDIKLLEKAKKIQFNILNESVNNLKKVFV